jgi:hypothetical protein
VEIWELAEMPKSDADAWIDRATREEVTLVLMGWHREQLIEGYTRDELIELVAGGIREGVRGYDEMEEKEVREELRTESSEIRADIEADRPEGTGT